LKTKKNWAKIASENLLNTFTLFLPFIIALWLGAYLQKGNDRGSSMLEILKLSFPQSLSTQFPPHNAVLNQCFLKRKYE
jgi:hypothetical protein